MPFPNAFYLMFQNFVCQESGREKLIVDNEGALLYETSDFGRARSRSQMEGFFVGHRTPVFEMKILLVDKEVTDRINKGVECLKYALSKYGWRIV